MKQFFETFWDYPILSTAVREFTSDVSNTFRHSYIFNFLNLKDKFNECDIKIEIINTSNPVEDQLKIDVEQIFPVIFNPIQLYKISSK